jgi:serine-type D-Ala-D-Ala carboxypeptidase/endopeptidase (penicillin-binding protein 4)
MMTVDCRLRKALNVTLVAVFVLAGLALPAAADSLEAIQAKIKEYLRRPGVRAAQWGIDVVDAENNVLFATNPDMPFMPASVLKVVTTSAALETLGPDFRFRTGIYTDGILEADGTLLGDLILVGRGDPNLMDASGELLARPALEELAEKLQAQGIRKIDGDIVGDDSYFEHDPHGNGWTARDLKAAYGAPISALSINNNVFWVHALPTKVKKAVSVSIEPRTSYFRIRNLGLTGGSRSNRTLYARMISGTRTLVISGVLPATQNYSRHLLLERPAEAVAVLLQEELKRRGIPMRGRIQMIHNGDVSPGVGRTWRLLAEHESPPLIRALEIINKQSQNLHAEMLLRTLGAEFEGTGSDEAGLEVVKRFIVSAGIDTHGINLKDGCGLSRENLVTPRFQTSLLQMLATKPYFDLFLNTLAVSGTDGTLKRRLAGQQVRGVIRAKTGSLNGVATLSGYMTTKSGRNLVFSIFANNAYSSSKRIRKTIDEICSLFVNSY